MSNLNTREDKLKIIFATYPDKNEVFMTSDDRAFFTQHQADGFGQTLQDREVKKYSRTEDGRPKTEVEKTEDGRPETEEAEKTEDGRPETEVEKTEDGRPETEEAEGLAMTEAPIDERAALAAKFKELFGKKPAGFMKTETIKAKIAEAEAAK